MKDGSFVYVPVCIPTEDRGNERGFWPEAQFFYKQHGISLPEVAWEWDLPAGDALTGKLRLLGSDAFVFAVAKEWEKG